MIRFSGRQAGIGNTTPVTPAPRGPTGMPPSDNRAIMDASARASGVNPDRSVFRVVTPTPAPAPRKPYR